ncbi:conserved protein of unknown function [Tenacibaculum sp. 190130A14a]|uniref:Uncharacterized protein n=1 Tax=Tenacibaculum polynesiense TaxID=3137857 RepID=A0ABP1ESL4_9FLAO
MTINDTTKLFKNLLSQTNKKSERRIYNCFIQVLSSLEKKELTKEQIDRINNKLTSLNLKEIRANRRKLYSQRLNEFKTFLKSEFSFTTEKYYAGIYMAYGMVFGSGIGLSLGTAINPTWGLSLGMSMGTSMGMLFGMLYGAKKDAEAKRQGRVL